MHKLLKLFTFASITVLASSCQHPVQENPRIQEAVAGTPIEVTPVFGGKFIPGRIGGGDDEFADNGPKVTCNVTLEIAGTNLIEVIRFHAKETRHNWTEVGGPPQRKVAYRGTRKILGFAPGQFTGGTVTYTDNGNGIDRATSTNPNQPIVEMQMIGRNKKREATVTTGVHAIQYRPVRIIVE